MNEHISSLHGIYSPLSGADGKKKPKSVPGPTHAKLLELSVTSLHMNNFFSTSTIGALLSLLFLYGLYS